MAETARTAEGSAYRALGQNNRWITARLPPGANIQVLGVHLRHSDSKISRLARWVLRSKPYLSVPKAERCSSYSPPNRPG